MNHQLHKIIGKIIKENFKSEGLQVLLDRACRGEQNLPLFSSRTKSRATEMCNVDILIMKNGKIKVIFEIEESDVKPTQICGKFLTSALSSYYIDKEDNKYPMDNSVLFIQILDTSKLNVDKTSKLKQWAHIEESIQKNILVKESRIQKYKLFSYNKKKFTEKTKEAQELVNFTKKYFQ